MSITDDIIVHGKPEQEHDTHMHRLMHVAAENDLMFNSSKCFIEVPQVTFFHTVYDKDGVHADLSKVEAIKHISLHLKAKSNYRSNYRREWQLTCLHSFPAWQQTPKIYGN